MRYKKIPDTAGNAARAANFYLLSSGLYCKDAAAPSATVGTGITPVRRSHSDRSRAIPPVWNFTKPQRYILLICRNNSDRKVSKVCGECCHSPQPYINYSMISETTPEPTVLPPSRIAKRRPFSIAIGVISSTVISTLSPGRHISTSAGRLMVPVTSVVLK